MQDMVVANPRREAVVVAHGTACSNKRHGHSKRNQLIMCENKRQKNAQGLHGVLEPMSFRSSRKIHFSI
jgi:hypothetical protein